MMRRGEDMDNKEKRSVYNTYAVSTFEQCTYMPNMCRYICNIWQYIFVKIYINETHIQAT
jgi:hypothetical protein